MRVDRRTSKGADLALEGGCPVRETWLPYGHQSVSDQDVAAVVAALRSEYLTQGPLVQEFEKKIAGICGVKYSVAFNSGTSALHSAYFAAGLKNGDEIVTSAMSFAATANAALYLGAVPRFADINPADGNVNPDCVEPMITEKTKAIVGVDYAGQPCLADELKAIASARGLRLIVDAAHSLGASYKGRPVGTLADMSVFSFHPVKTITTGEGGMVVTDDEELAHKMRLFRSHGIEKDALRLSKNPGPWYHEMQLLGYNYRITDLQAALGISQLDRLQAFVERRRQIAAIYRQELFGNEHFVCLEEKPEVRSSHHLFPVLVRAGAKAREFVVKALHKENIGVQVHYIPTYHHPYYQERFGNIWNNRCPNTEEFYNQEVSLPIFPDMTDEDVADVLAALAKVSAFMNTKGT